MNLVPLPIDPLLPEIVSTVRTAASLVLEAPPGAGKTTRVPRALLESKVTGDKEILVLQPRRLPTRLAAHRVAEEMNSAVGEAVGYQVRFEDISGPRTRLKFVTEGVLARRLLSDPQLRGVGAVAIDEFHERHLAGDVTLALLRRLQLGARPDLKLLVMSATLDAAPIARFLGDAPVLRSEGKRFDVALEYLPAPDERPLEQQVLAGMKRLIQSGLDGHVLVFLPGAGEIRRAAEACGELAQRHGLEIHALHGELPAAEQDRAVARSQRTKLILSTNVAETSVTIDGVSAVIDGGLARVASHSPWSGLPVLKLAKVSRASATQRAGRAGRTRPGRCLRLYTRPDFDARPEHEPPEIRRADLAETALQLRSTGVTDLTTFPFFEPPPPASLEAAELLLQRLGAVTAAGQVTPLGNSLLRFPVHPRLARVIVEGERRAVAEKAVSLAALLGERDIRRGVRADFAGRGGRSGPTRATQSGPSDLLELLELFEEAERDRFSPDRLRGRGLDAGAVQAVNRVRQQLRRMLRGKDSPAGPPPGPLRDQALMLCLLAGFPDRIARRLRPRRPELALFGGGSATLSEQSVVLEPDLLVAIDAEERGGKGAAAVRVRLASQVEPEWLLDLFPDAIAEEAALEWNAGSGRVEKVSRIRYGDLLLEETRTPAPSSPQASTVLLEQLRAGRIPLPGLERMRRWLARVGLLARALPEAGLPAIDPAFLQEAWIASCDGATSLDALSQVSIEAAAEARLTPAQLQLLATAAPEKVGLPGGRQVPVHYERDQPPWIESRLQDFFGMARGPQIARGRVPLVLHLLAPNQRAVQVTTDLAGFWERHYPGIRKELMRKYPRHLWPEDPLHAQPPAPGRRR